MSVHRDCGEDIRWAHRSDDPERFHPPLEYAGQGYIIDDAGNAIQVQTYKMHRCDPQKVRDWQEYIQTMEDLKGPDSFEGRINYHNAARERTREQAWQLALQVECPKCEADPGQKCCSLSAHLVKTGEIVDTLWPHPARTEAALRKEGNDDNND